MRSCIVNYNHALIIGLSTLLNVETVQKVKVNVNFIDTLFCEYIKLSLGLKRGSEEVPHLQKTDCIQFGFPVDSNVAALSQQENIKRSIETSQTIPAL